MSLTASGLALRRTVELQATLPDRLNVGFRVVPQYFQGNCEKKLETETGACFRTFHSSQCKRLPSHHITRYRHDSKKVTIK